MPHTMVSITCSYCRKVVLRRLGNYNQKKKQGSKQYCSHSCAKKDHPTKGRDIAERFWAKVHKTDTCWIWTGGTADGGYGIIWYKVAMRRASHISYFLQHGVFPDSPELLHTCDNPACVRPDHLVPGTHAENMLDMKNKGRGGAGSHVRGETNGRSKLKTADVMAIRERLANGEKHRAIAQDYGVSRTTITSINRRQNWGYMKSDSQ